jgi:hypothetical protein
LEVAGVVVKYGEINHERNEIDESRKEEAWGRTVAQLLNDEARE